MDEPLELRTWVALNSAMRTASEKECLRLLEAETKGKARQQFIYRIHSRLNRVRAARERVELRKSMA